MSVIKSSDYATLHLAAAASSAQSKTLLIDQSYTLSQTLTLTEHTLALPHVTLTSSAEIAVRIGDGANPVTLKTINLPQIVSSAQRWTANEVDGGDVGLWVAGASLCRVIVPEIRNFSVGLLVTDTSNDDGCSQNQYTLQYLRNNAVQVRLQKQHSGYVSEQTFYGGVFSYNSGQADAIAGTRQIENLSPNSGNTWIKPNLESNVAEYLFYTTGQYNVVQDARWEWNGAGAAKAHFGAGAKFNRLMHGGSLALVEVTADETAVANMVEYLNADGLQQVIYPAIS